MGLGVMITNGGPHPPEKWAAQTAEQLLSVVTIEPSFPDHDKALQEKNELSIALEKAMVGHHTHCRDHTKGHLAMRGHNLAPLHDVDLSPHVDSCLDDATSAVLDATRNTMFAGHFQKPEVVRFVRSTLSSHFASVAHIEHSWHRDRQHSEKRA